MSSRSVYVPLYKEIKKENGNVEPYEFDKAKNAIYKAMVECEGFKQNKTSATKIAKEVETNLYNSGKKNISTHDWANEAISVMSDKGYKELANTYKKRIVQKSLNRLKNSSLMKSFNDVLGSSGDDPNSINTENANIDGFNPAAQLHRIGSEANKGFVLDYLLPRNLSRIHREKWIHIHDLDYFELNPNCLQIDLKATLKDGFSTGNGLNTEPHSILTATMLAAIVLQSSTNNMHGGQSIMNLDYALAKYVNLSFRKHFQKAVDNYYMISGKEKPSFLNKRFYNKLYYGIDSEYIKKYQEDYLPSDEGKFTAAKIKVFDRFLKVANGDTEKETNQAMQGLCHNLSTLHSRAADQVPFSSVNLGLDVSEAGRLVTRCLINNLINGSGRGETFIYPITIFHILEGINYFPSDPNYDLFQLAMKSSSTRLYPNYVFVDSPFQFVYIRNKHGKLLWKAKEDWYIEKGYVTREELDAIESKDDIVNENIYARIRKVAAIDRNLRKSNKENPDLFDVVKFMTGKGNPNFDKRARINGCQFPSAIDSLCRGFDDRTTPARMGCRTLTISDALAKYGINDEPSKRYKFERNVRPPYGYTAGRGNFNFVTLNLPRFAIDAIKNTKHAKIEQKNTDKVLDETVSKFYKNVLYYMIEAKNILKIKLDIISKKPVKNFSFITGEGLVLGSYGMSDSDETGELWHHFSKSIGYIGIYETIMLLYNKTQIEMSEEAFNIVLFMRKVTDLMSKGYYILPTEQGLKDDKWYESIFNTDESTYSNSNLDKSEWDEKFQVYDIDNNPICLRNKNKLYKDNWSVFATPAEGACSSFCKADLKEYGKIKNVTDKDYYTNSNHVDVREKVTVEEKAKFEGRFHSLATAGNIFYVEADGIIGKNNKAYKDILTVMHDNEMGYVAVNVPNDHCEVCRYQGVIPEGENCPHCGAGEEYITRIRRITGYLGYTNKGGSSRFNSGKAAEERNRVKHV